MDEYCDTLHFERGEKQGKQTYPKGGEYNMSTRQPDFGDLGLKIGDEIICTPNNETYTVTSGAGVPDNGYLLVSGADEFD